MAEEAYIVAYDIQNAGNANAVFSKTELKISTLGSKETSVGNAEWEGKGTSNGANGAKSGLYAHQGCNIVSCKMVELKSGTAAEAVEYVRLNLAQNAGGERAVVKPNETNFQVIV
jgi:hypothetical protein